MELKLESLEIPEGCNVILGQTFITPWTTRDYGRLCPQRQVWIAFCEASPLHHVAKAMTSAQRSSGKEYF
jgi:adenosine/AMP kinase